MSAPDPAADGSSLECNPGIPRSTNLDLRRAGSVTRLFTEGHNTFYDGAPGFSRDGSRVVIAPGYSVDPASYFLRVYFTGPLSAHRILSCGFAECRAPVWSPDRKHMRSGLLAKPRPQTQCSS
jgi:hypothetical protein